MVIIVARTSAVLWRWYRNYVRALADLEE